MNVATQIVLSVLVLILLGWSVYRERVISEMRAERRVMYRRGKNYGMKVERRHWLDRRRAELHAAGRVADERPDSGPSARVAPITFHRRHDL